MYRLTDFPLLLFVVAIVAQWLCAWLGATVFTRRNDRGTEEREDFGLVLAAALTLLGLIIGFTFSMAVNRYDQRKNYEAAEANAIGTEYLRADLLPPADAANVRVLLGQYLEQRILHYTTRDRDRLRQLDAQTTLTQRQLWSTVQAAAHAQPTAPITLAAAGMNDVLNSQGYTLAAWLNRIPRAAWQLLAVTALLCNLMIGYAAGRLGAHVMLLTILPLIVSIAFLLIADIDSPRGGIINVAPENLLSLAETLHR